MSVFAVERGFQTAKALGMGVDVGPEGARYVAERLDDLREIELLGFDDLDTYVSERLKSELAGMRIRMRVFWLFTGLTGFLSGAFCVAAFLA